MKRFLKAYWQWPATFSLLLFGHFCLTNVTVADTLTLTIAGSGAGSVNSDPAGIACTSSNSPCSASFANLSGITLNATPDWQSLDGVFGGGCSGVGSCFFNIDGETGVTAIFEPDYQAALMITHPEIEPKFSSLNDAYTYANTYSKSNFSLNARVKTFSENLILNNPINFTLAGGKNSGYYTNVGYTTLAGYVEVQNGSIAIDSLIIQ